MCLYTCNSLITVIHLTFTVCSNKIDNDPLHVPLKSLDFFSIPRIWFQFFENSAQFQNGFGEFL